MNITDLLKMLRKFWIIELAIVVAATGLTALMVRNETPVYSTSTQIMVRTQSESTDLTSVNASLYAISNQMETFTSLVKTESVLQPVIDRLGLHTTTQELSQRVSATQGSGTMMTISANDADPQTAADITNQTAESLHDLIVNDLYTDGGKLTTPIEFSVVQKAYAPTKPISPNVKAEMAKGVLVGIALAVAVALALGLMDQKIRQVEDVEALVDSPVVGTLQRNPVFTGSAPVVVAQPGGAAAEAVRRIAANLTFVVPEDAPRSNVVVVTSGSAGEGKSTLSVNLASAYAEKGETVLLVDADLRKPSVDRYLGINGAVGLTHLITGQAGVDEVCQRYWKRNFHVLPAGARTANPSLLLGSSTMRDEIDRFAAQYDHVIIDTTPMDVSNDAAMFAKEGALVVLVVGESVATRKSLRGVTNEFRMIGAPLTATVVNFAEKQRRKGKQYYYYEAAQEEASQEAQTAPAAAQVMQEPAQAGASANTSADDGATPAPAPAAPAQAGDSSDGEAR